MVIINGMHFCGKACQTYSLYVNRNHSQYSHIYDQLCEKHAINILNYLYIHVFNISQTFTGFHLPVKHLLICSLHFILITFKSLFSGFIFKNVYMHVNKDVFKLCVSLKCAISSVFILLTISYTYFISTKLSIFQIKYNGNIPSYCLY